MLRGRESLASIFPVPVIKAGVSLTPLLPGLFPALRATRIARCGNQEYATEITGRGAVGHYSPGSIKAGGLYCASGFLTHSLSNIYRFFVVGR